MQNEVRRHEAKSVVPFWGVEDYTLFADASGS
jgi:hypothetical protein